MNKDKLKNVVIVILILIIVVGITFVVSELSGKGGVRAISNNNTSYNNEEVVDIPEEEQKEHTEIDIDKYLALKEGSELSIIYIARPTCGFCVKQGPELKNVAYLYNLNINYLNTDELDQDGFNKLIASDSYFSEGFGTPLTLLVKDNKIVDKAEGYRTKDELITFFKTNNLIAE